MKEIVVSGNRPCFCNSGKKFKSCHGFSEKSEIMDTYKIHFLIRDVYEKVLRFVNQNFDVKEFLEQFRTYNNIPEDSKDKHEFSFIFIDFLLFRAKDKGSNQSIYEKIVRSGGILSGTELKFMEDVKNSAKFSIFRVASVDKDENKVELENIFSKKVSTFYDKVSASRIDVGGLLYGRVYDIFTRTGVLPTFNYKQADLVKGGDLDKVVENFEKRFENVKKDDGSLMFEDFVDSIEYEIYGGDNPYEVFEFDDRFEQYKKEHPNKTFEDFLDDVEDEMLGI